MTDRTAFVTTILTATALISGVLIAGFQHIGTDYDRAYSEMVRLYQEAANDRERRDQAAAQDRERRDQAAAQDRERRDQAAAQDRAGLETAANAAHTRIEERLLRVENILLGQAPDANRQVKD